MAPAKLIFKNYEIITVSCDPEDIWSKINTVEKRNIDFTFNIPYRFRKKYDLPTEPHKHNVCVEFKNNILKIYIDPFYLCECFDIDLIFMAACYHSFTGSWFISSKNFSPFSLDPFLEKSKNKKRKEKENCIEDINKI